MKKRKYTKNSPQGATSVAEVPRSVGLTKQQHIAQVARELELLTDKESLCNLEYDALCTERDKRRVAVMKECDAIRAEVSQMENTALDAIADGYISRLNDLDRQAYMYKQEVDGRRILLANLLDVGSVIRNCEITGCTIKA